MGVKRLWTTLAGAAAIAAGCGAAPAPGAGDGNGQIKLALAAMAGSTTYVLANATFLTARVQPPPAPDEISGIRLSASDPAAGDVTATNLPVGRYTVTLL